MKKRNCSKCEKLFSSSKPQTEDLLCFRCAVKHFTKGLFSEEGDLNTAKIISGTLTSDEERWLKEDLRAVEGPIDPALDFYNEHAPDHWYEVKCLECGYLQEYCICDFD